MVKRKRSKLENFFNLNRYKKRQGAKQIMQANDDVDFDKLKNTIIEGNPSSRFESPMIKDLNKHIVHLKKDFQGQSELLYYHAKLIVLIRREANIAQNFANFNYLWQEESEFLLENLNMRWLASAIDTFIDHHSDPTAKAIYLNAIILINTVKLYETERHLLAIENTDEETYPADRFELIQADCIDLFDGMPSFRIGVDDTFRNMRWRMDEVSQNNPLAQKILIHIFERINSRGSAYTRFRKSHSKMRNAWWSDELENLTDTNHNL